MNRELQFGEKFLKWWYEEGGCWETLYGLNSPSVSQQIKKAIGPWDAPSSPYNYYFDYVFSAQVFAYVSKASEVFKLLPKTTYQAEGDSIKYFSSDLGGLVGVSHSSTPFYSGSAESAPTVSRLAPMYPAFVVDPWETSLISRTIGQWQNDPQLDAEWIKQYHADNLPNQIDKMLTLTVDTPANDGSSVFNIESIDRICSGYAEASTTYVSSAADPDLFWSNSSALIDRSADSSDVFGCGAGEGLDLPATGAARTLTLDMIDDVVAAIAPYSKKKRYIAITGPKTLNEIQKLIDPKQRFLDTPVDYELTLNGVSTRKGAKAGFTVGAYIASGIEIPFFTCTHVANETAENRSATITDANIGNIYLLDLDSIELRIAIPVTYLETPPAGMLSSDFMKYRHMFLFAAQLLATNFRAHGAVKYLKSS